MKDNLAILGEIDSSNLQIKDMLIHAKSSLDIYDVISKNAKAINQKPRDGDFWAFVQKVVMDSLILNLCKIFEKDKVNGYEQNSINRIIAIIENNSLEPKHPDSIAEFLKKYASEVKYEYKGKFTIYDFCEICRKFISKYKDALDKLKTARDKIVAHNDVMQKVTHIASISDIEKILDFGYDFYSTISNAYLNVGPIDIRNHKRKKNNLEYLFKQLGFITSDRNNA